MTEGPDRWLCQASGVTYATFRAPVSHKVRLSFWASGRGKVVAIFSRYHLVAVRSQKVLCHSFPWRDAAAGLRSPSGRASGAVIHLLCQHALTAVFLCIRVHGL